MIIRRNGRFYYRDDHYMVEIPIITLKKLSRLIRREITEGFCDHIFIPTLGSVSKPASMDLMSPPEDSACNLRRITVISKKKFNFRDALLPEITQSEVNNLNNLMHSDPFLGPSTRLVRMAPRFYVLINIDNWCVFINDYGFALYNQTIITPVATYLTRYNNNRDLHSFTLNPQLNDTKVYSLY